MRLFWLFTILLWASIGSSKSQDKEIQFLQDEFQRLSQILQSQATFLQNQANTSDQVGMHLIFPMIMRDISQTDFIVLNRYNTSDFEKKYVDPVVDLIFESSWGEEICLAVAGTAERLTYFLGVSLDKAQQIQSSKCSRKSRRKKQSYYSSQTRRDYHLVFEPSSGVQVDSWTKMKMAPCAPEAVAGMLMQAGDGGLMAGTIQQSWSQLPCTANQTFVSLTPAHMSLEHLLQVYIHETAVSLDFKNLSGNTWFHTYYPHVEFTNREDQRVLNSAEKCSATKAIVHPMIRMGLAAIRAFRVEHEIMAELEQKGLVKGSDFYAKRFGWGTDDEKSCIQILEHELISNYEANNKYSSFEAVYNLGQALGRRWESQLGMEQGSLGDLMGFGFDESEAGCFNGHLSFSTDLAGALQAMAYLKTVGLRDTEKNRDVPLCEFLTQPLLNDDESRRAIGPRPRTGGSGG